MMPISDAEGYPIGHFTEVYHQLIRPAVEAAGYECHRADTTNSAHMIQLEIVTLAATADLCICDLSTANPNVLFEYGIRQAFDKPTVLIRDNRTRRLFDVIGFRDIEYDANLRIANTLTARERITSAIADTVDGADDDRQVFSLVKLMQLSAASLPAAGLDPVQAQIQLLSKQIDSLSSRLARANGLYLTPSELVSQMNLSRAEPTHPIPTNRLAVSNKGTYLDQFSDGSVIFRRRDEADQNFPSVAAFLSSEWAENLPDHVLAAIKLPKR
jgi:hypothetical protein